MNIIKNITIRQQTIVAASLIFIAFFIIEFLTPFHSDDFSYGQMGLTWAKHWRHYMGWSGRLVADYSSSLILLCQNHAVVSAIMAFFAASTCYLIAALPGKIFGTTFSPFKFVVITALFWVCNPNLGQTTFWVVGACNYLVTNFFIVLFLYVFLAFRNSRSWKLRSVLFLLALLAGCTNENTSLALVYTFIVMCLLMKFFRTEFDIKNAFICTAGLVIGMLVLLLAPGNYARANHPAFRWFKTVSLPDKIRMQWHRGSYLRVFWEAYVLCGLGLFGLYIQRKFDRNGQKILWSLLFLSSSLAAFVVMTESPSMPLRAYSGVLFFLLISLSFALELKFFNGKLGWGLSLLGTACIAGAIWSWTCVYISYGITKEQEAIRNDHINYEKLIHGAVAQPTIPDWYFVNLLSSRDKFDMYHSGAMSRWFGVYKVNLITGVDYDYSVLRTGAQITTVNKTNLEAPAIRIRPASWRYRQNGTVILETTSDIRNQKLSIAFYPNRGHNKKIVPLSHKVLFLQGKYYTGVTIRKLPDIANIEILSQ